MVHPGTTPQAASGVSLEVVIRGDWEGFALYLERPNSVEPGECLGVFNTLTGAARAAAAAKQAVAELHAMRAPA